MISNNGANILSWESQGLFDENIRPLSTSNKMLNPSLNYSGTKGSVKPNGDCLKQEKSSLDHRKVVNTYIV